MSTRCPAAAGEVVRGLRLGDLIDGLEGASLSGNPDIEVSGLAYDSRRVRPGDLFLCIPGFVHDGHDFIPEALARGAVACLVERWDRVPEGVAAARVPAARPAAARLAARFYGFPTRELRLIGVTGTNGKTTTTFLIREILARRGGVGLVGTVHNVVGGEVLPVEHTTPEAVDLQALFRQMAGRGDRAAVMEVSSHALALHRVDGCEFDVGVFTNITRDHLDFHRDFGRYLSAKARLFRMLGRGAEGPPAKEGAKGAVVNADDPSARVIVDACRVPVLTYAVDERADVMATGIDVRLDGASFTVHSPRGRHRVRLRLTGRFNVYNALAAFGAGLVEGADPDEMVAALESVAGVPGRFERVTGVQDFAVIVDYAHTPDGLENVLQAARRGARGRGIAVFGCGGDRDRTKRPIMGEIAARLADLVFITSDNPRSEDPAAIAAEVEAGARRVPGASCRTVLDREEAIGEAIAEARGGDVVLIAGKGHETYQKFRDRTVPFDDREVAGRWLSRLGYRG